MERQKRIVVAGATGCLGRHVVRALHRHGWKVRALARMFALLGECDAVGPRHGDHRLEDHFEGLAKGPPGESG